MPSSTMTLAASRSLSGAGPHTRTSTSVSKAAASSTARRLSSRRAPRSAAATAGAQPSAASRTLQWLVVFWLRLRRDGSGGEGLTSGYPGDGEHASHTFDGEVWVVQEPGPVCEDEQLGEVRHRAGALLSPDHSKVILMAVYVGHKDYARLVVAGRGPEDVAAEGDGGREYIFVAVCVPSVEGLQGGRSRGGDGVEDAEEGVGEAFFIAQDQAGVVEVVARVHPDAIGEAAAYLDLAACIEEGDFDAVDLVGVVFDNRQAYLRGGV